MSAVVGCFEGRTTRDNAAVIAVIAAAVGLLDDLGRGFHRSVLGRRRVQEFRVSKGDDCQSISVGVVINLFGGIGVDSTPAIIVDLLNELGSFEKSTAILLNILSKYVT